MLLSNLKDIYVLLVFLYYIRNSAVGKSFPLQGKIKVANPLDSTSSTSKGLSLLTKMENAVLR